MKKQIILFVSFYFIISSGCGSNCDFIHREEVTGNIHGPVNLSDSANNIWLKESKIGDTIVYKNNKGKLFRYVVIHDSNHFAEYKMPGNIVVDDCKEIVTSDFVTHRIRSIHLETDDDSNPIDYYISARTWELSNYFDYENTGFKDVISFKVPYYENFYYTFDPGEYRYTTVYYENFVFDSVNLEKVYQLTFEPLDYVQEIYFNKTHGLLGFKYKDGGSWVRTN